MLLKRKAPILVRCFNRGLQSRDATDIDGLIFGDYTGVPSGFGAVGVDVEGDKHVLGIREGATENSTVITALLEDIVAQGRRSQAQDAVRYR